MNAFLASTRNLGEARMALAAGAEWIDFKEPAAGALGAVEFAEIESATRWLKRARDGLPVSATIGDCWDDADAVVARVGRLAGSGIDYAKVGLYAANPEVTFVRAVTASCANDVGVILVCFAELPPDTAAIATWAGTGIAGMMLDTADKSAGSLTQRLTPASIRSFVRDVHRHGLLCGLAGSLGFADIPLLAPHGADYLGFRGALCGEAGRAGRLSPRAAGSVRAALDRTRNTDSTTDDGTQEDSRGMAQETER